MSAAAAAAAARRTGKLDGKRGKDKVLNETVQLVTFCTNINCLGFCVTPSLSDPPYG